MSGRRGKGNLAVPVISKAHTSQVGRLDIDGIYDAKTQHNNMYKQLMDIRLLVAALAFRYLAARELVQSSLVLSVV